MTVQAVPFHSSASGLEAASGLAVPIAAQSVVLAHEIVVRSSTLVTRNFRQVWPFHWLALPALELVSAPTAMQSVGLPHHSEVVLLRAGFILDHDVPFHTSVNCVSFTMQNDLPGQEMLSGAYIKGMLTSRQERRFHITDWKLLTPTH